MRALFPLLLWGCLVPDAMVQAYLDRDGDGFRTVAAGGADCDDGDRLVSPQAHEVCGNGIDDDCDGQVDDRGLGALTFFTDGDDDGFGDTEAPVVACSRQPGLSPEGGDCDDDDRNVHPLADEDCSNGIDDDCDGTIDRDGVPAAWFPDLDGDGYGNGRTEAVRSCAALVGYSQSPTDCDDTDPGTHPGAAEIPYDGRDNGCDGIAQEFDLDGDGYWVDPAWAVPEVTAAAYAPDGGQPLDCNDRRADIFPGAEDLPYDGEDRNCDGADDYDADGDGHRPPGYGGDDCDDADPERHPGRAEIYYDGKDDDCDPRNDNDADLDGRPGMEVGGTDCDDHDPNNWSRCLTCEDADRDDAYRGCDAYITIVEDCDDTNQDVWVSCHTCRDADDDGRYAGCDAYRAHAQDCDDGDPGVWSRCSTCADEDGDGHRDGCDAYPSATRDCDDTLANAWSTCATCSDADRDGWGTGTCDALTDCDDTDPDTSSTCGSCVDADGDGSRTGCDRYLRSPYDCDDADPEVGGHVFEILGDGLDQDCDGRDLTVSDDSGVFVAQDGVDEPGCGVMAWPCATPGYAEDLAFKAGKVLFVGAGVYEGFSTRVSIYASRDPGTFDVGDGRTILYSTNKHPVFESIGPAVTLASFDIEIDVPPGTSVATGLAVVSSFLQADGLKVRMVGTPTKCSIVSGQGRTLVIKSSVIEGCESSTSTAGISWRQSNEASSARLDGASVRPLGSGTVTGVDVECSTLKVDKSVIDVTSGVTSVGLRHTGGESTHVADSRLFVGVGGLSERATGMVAESSSVHASGSIFDAEGTETARGIDLDSISASATWTAISAAFGASAPESAIAISTSGVGTLDIAYSTLATRYTENSASIVTPSGVSISVLASVLSSPSTAIAAQGAYSVVDSVFSSTCLVAETPFGSFCAAPAALDLTQCTHDRCVSSSNVYVEDEVLEAGSSSWMELRSSSVAVDYFYTSPPGPVTTTDAVQQRRPKGNGWDLGGIER